MVNKSAHGRATGEAFLAGGGDMGALMRAHPWHETTLGPARAWPRSLKTAVRIMLNSPQPVWIGWGADLIVFYNDALRPILGSKHPWALGEPASRVWQERWADLSVLLADAIEGDAGTYVAQWLLMMERNGHAEETYFTVSYTSIPGDDGLPAGILCTNTDETASQRVLEAVCDQIHGALGNAAAYAEADRQAEVWAELDRAQTALANVSLEFRSPVSLVLGLLADSMTVADERPSAPVSRARMLNRDARRLFLLVNALCAFYSIETGRAETTPEPTDLAAVTALIAGNFQPLMERGGLALHIDCPPLPQPVAVDRAMWEMIVLNLLANAFKFTLAGSVSVHLRAGGGKACLSVRDTGLGIPAAALPHLFERAQPLRGAPGRGIEGSGIGLPLVQALARLHGGDIQVESTEGRGSTVTVEIPLDARGPVFPSGEGSLATAEMPLLRGLLQEAMRWLPGMQRAVSEPDLAFPPQDAPAAVSDTSILVAADKPDMRDYLGRLLGARYHCRVAADGAEALALLRQRRSDLVLTDGMMRGLDGFGLVQAIRDDAELRDLPVILLSPGAGEEASVEGLTAGADGYLAKPFSARELLARVDGALALARIRRDMGEALRDEARALELLNRIGADLAADLDLDRAVQRVTDATTTLIGAAFGAFFFNTRDAAGEAYRLYTLSGAPRSAFDHFPLPRNTALFGPTFFGTGIIRCGDVRSDPRFGKNAPFNGLPEGHLPVRSYLAAPVIARTGEVLGGLFFGHPEPDIFSERDERMLVGIAGQAATAIDNARLYRAAQEEIERRRSTEAALRDSQDALMRLNQTLEARVMLRTAELATANEKLRAEAEERAHIEQVLRQSQKMEAVGKLTGGIAHDFNNLLQVIGGNLQLLAKELTDNPRAEQRLANALSGVSRGSKLASQLLAFGRRQPLAPKVVNLGRFIRGLDDLLRRALGDGIAIETEISAGLWNTLVDPIQVESALLNLAINARDAMSGHGRLTIEAGNAQLDDAYAARHGDVMPGQYIMLAVTDTGCGMTPEIIEQVFEPFFTTKPEGQGTGLGLSMVYGFVKQSQGHIKIDSEPGQGTTIRLFLPRVHAMEDLSTEMATGPIEGGSETVLVVEDDDDVRGTVVAMLADLGYRVLKAPDAESALAIIEGSNAIDLLFTDVVMPGSLRSPDLARRAQMLRPGLAVLFTSGYTDNAIVHDGRLDVGIELLSKPYTREELARKIRHVLHTRERPVAGAAEGQGEASPPVAAADPSRITRTILLAEDDALIRLTTAEMLGMLGHTVFESETAAAAEAIFAAETIDILITDLGLPDRRGDELAQAVFAQQPELGIIFATGEGGPPEVRDPRLNDAAVLLLKPYGLAELTEAVAAADARRAGRGLGGLGRA